MQSLSVDQLKAFIATEPQALLLDVREPWEVALARIDLAGHLSSSLVNDLMAEAEAGRSFEIDLEEQTIIGSIRFEISPRRRRMLLDGFDELGLTLAMEPKIVAFEAADRARRPWIYPPT